MIGKKLVELRLNAGKTQKEVCDLLSISRASLGHWENDNREPSFEMLSKIADLYDVSIGYIFGEESKSNDEKLSKFTKDLLLNKLLEDLSLLENLDDSTKQEVLKDVDEHILKLSKKS